jgi:hypothetical protein
LVEFEGYFLEGAESVADADVAQMVLPPRLSELRGPVAATATTSGATTSGGGGGGFTVSRLDSLRSETKYSANSVSCRLTGRYTIKSFTLQVGRGAIPHLCPLFRSFLAHFAQA